ncbi:MAG TPA: hypothetical protein VNA24_05465 [Hyalangium sp.]|nr:hypothetical protein [Hyalangium sp.]
MGLTRDDPNADAGNLLHEPRDRGAHLLPHLRQTWIHAARGVKAEDDLDAVVDQPPGETVRIRPASLEKYVVFVQSTSNNRKLMGGTRFLYEVEDFDGARA